jgi:hypothetical protein
VKRSVASTFNLSKTEASGSGGPAPGAAEAGVSVFHHYRLIYSDLDRDQLKERIWEAGRDWDVTMGEVSQVMREFYEGQ